ncbi:hypothetical protein ACIGKQ_10105 [Gordonia sp. NPDC062954]|uniref:hypothetical protein n=1 Tax=Gordonia sp. NPDC062954 TaxID=3364003 RepID=UPI0037CB193C
MTIDDTPDTRPLRVCIVGASGKLGRYMIQHCLDRGYQVVGVCGRRACRNSTTSLTASRSFPAAPTIAR